MSSRQRRGRRRFAARPEIEPPWFDSLPQVDGDLRDVEPFDGPTRANTKTNQLCRQVEQALLCALVCAENPLLRDAVIVGVRPLRGPALLQVLIEPGGLSYDPMEMENALERANGYLRSEVARSIHRKRTPSLRFAVVMAPARGPHRAACDE